MKSLLLLLMAQLVTVNAYCKLLTTHCPLASDFSCLCGPVYVCQSPKEYPLLRRPTDSMLYVNEKDFKRFFQQHTYNCIRLSVDVWSGSKECRTPIVSFCKLYRRQYMHDEPENQQHPIVVVGAGNFFSDRSGISS